MNGHEITRISTHSIPAQGTCCVCGAERVMLWRTYHHYDGLKCECHSPNHFDIYHHCRDCVPAVNGSVSKSMVWTVDKTEYCGAQMPERP